MGDYHTDGVGNPEDAVKEDSAKLAALAGPEGKTAGGDGGFMATVMGVALGGGSIFAHAIGMALHAGLSGGSKSNEPPKAPTAGQPQTRSKSVFIKDRTTDLTERAALAGQALKDTKGVKFAQQAIAKLKKSVDAAKYDLQGFNRFKSSSARLETNQGTLVGQEVKDKAPDLLSDEVTSKNKPEELVPKDKAVKKPKSLFTLPAPTMPEHLDARAGRQ
jgi:hypothetical protein